MFAPWRSHNPLLKRDVFDYWKIIHYRPISVLPVISKILEEHVCKHFIAFLTNQDLLYKWQSGFRANHSCESILIKITDEWLEAMVG